MENINLTIEEDGGSKPSTECACCCEKFNKSLRKMIVCTNGTCDYVVCKECVRTYLLSTTETPHCMNCKHAWNDRFVVQELNASFVNNDYKKHRKQLLLEHELSKMPETMPAVARWYAKKEYQKNDKELLEKRQLLKQQLNEIEQMRNELYHQYFQHGTGDDDSQNQKKYTFKCPDDECRGFLTTAYKCEICKYYACPKCLVLTGHERNDPTHVCDENLVKTADLIRESSKPCPNCRERIIKASGCDQMWCTSCHTAFSWKTGKIDNGVIHNPHFYQFQNQTRTQVRNPGDQVCGGLPGGWWDLTRKMRRLLCGDHMQKHPIECSCKAYVDANYTMSDVTSQLSEVNTLMRQYHIDLVSVVAEIYNMVRRINDYELPNHRRLVRDLRDNEELRVRYSVKEIDKEKLAAEVIKRDKKRKRVVELMHIYELISSVGNDMMNHLFNFYNENPQMSYSKKIIEFANIICEEFSKKIREFEIFINYINKQFKIISATYSIKVPQLDINSTPIMYYPENKFKLCEIETSA